MAIAAVELAFIAAMLANMAALLAAQVAAQEAQQALQEAQAAAAIRCGTPGSWAFSNPRVRRGSAKGVKGL